MAHSVVYDQYKEAKRRRIREQRSASAKAVPRDDIVANLTMQELLQIVRQELQAFPKDSKYGRAFELREVDDLDYPEVAAELEITVDEAHHWVATARVRLRKALQRRGITLSVTVLAALLAAHTAKAAIPTAGMIWTTKSMIAAVVLSLILVTGASVGVGVYWNASGTSGSDATQTTKSSTTGRSFAAGTVQLPLPNEPDPRQHLLEAVCVPRMIAALQSIGGTAKPEKAVVDGDEVVVVMDWTINPLSKAPMRVMVKYRIEKHEFLMWRDGSDGVFAEVDPEQPIYWVAFPGAPKIVAGKSQVQEMKDALSILK